MKARFCYRCGREFREGEGYHFIYIRQTGKMVPVCREDRNCHWQRQEKAAREAVDYAKGRDGNA